MALISIDPYPARPVPAWFGVTPLHRPLDLAWMYLLFPIGWAMSYLVSGLMYYLVITPIGLLMRALGRDPMQRRFEPDATSY